MSRIGKWIGLVGVLAALALAAPSWAQTGGLTGKTILVDKTPCVKCPVEIDRQDIKGHYEVKTDKKGEYTYIGLPVGKYKVTLEDPSGKVLFFIAQGVEVGDPTEVDFDLPKEMANAKQTQMANPEVQKQQEEAAKEKQQYTGLKQVFDEGQQLYADKKYTEAAAAFEQALPLAKDKNLIVIQEHLADSYRMAKVYDKAIDMYTKLIAANPAEAEFHNNLGSVYADQGKIPDAQKEFETAAQLNPTNAGRYYFNMGVIMVNTGKMDDAAVALKKATDVDPTNADAFYWYGMALLGKADYKPDGTIVPAPGTIEAFQTYLKLAPTGQYAELAQATMTQLGGKVETEFKNKKQPQPAPKKKS
jgi:tetratricopeptide (TPR) repeat protein